MSQEHTELQRLLAEVKTAKVNHRDALGGRLDVFRVEATRSELLVALETYASALDGRHLPIPPTVSRDLQMWRRLCAPSRRKRR